MDGNSKEKTLEKQGKPCAERREAAHAEVAALRLTIPNACV
jgi:hypothetical protein